MKIFTNNWVVTLTATLVGVFVALYLNEIVASNKLEDQKSIATKNILLEIQENQRNIEKNIEKHTAMFSILEFMNECMDKESRLITSVDSMQSFRVKHPEIFIVKDSTLVTDGKYHYQGELDLNFDLSYINVTSFSWATLKNSSLTTSYDFNCLVFLEKLDIITKETLNLERNVLDMLWEPENYENDGFKNRLMRELKFLIEHEKGLLEGYKVSEEKLSNCG